MFTEPKVSDAAEVQAIGFSPGISAVGCFRAVERVAGVLEGFVGVSGPEVGFGKGQALALLKLTIRRGLAMMADLMCLAHEGTPYGSSR